MKKSTMRSRHDERSQRQNRMRRSSLMPDKQASRMIPTANERCLHQSDLSLAEIDKGPHQTTAAGAGEKRTGKIESADALSDALVHSGDDEETGDRSAIGTLIRKAQRHETCVTISVPSSGPATLATAHAAGGRAQRPAAFVRRVNHSEQNKRKGRNGSRSNALDGASADELDHLYARWRRARSRR